MNEADLKKALCEELRTLPHPAVVTRHEPGTGTTPGTPDISVTHRGRTVWLEVKYLKRETQAALDACSPPLQRAMCRKLHGASLGRCLYVVYAGVRQKAVALYSPHSLYIDNPLLTTGGFAHDTVRQYLEEELFR